MACETRGMIEARRLHILRAVADHRTVTAAAAALYLTPSAVSQQLAALEQETGHRLVDRSARGARLTPAGEILLSHANAVLAQLERAESALAAYSSGEAGTAPGIRVLVRDAEGDESLLMVLDRQVDVAVAVEYRGAPGEDDARLTRVPLHPEPFDAVLPTGHPLAPGEKVALADLAKDTWIGQSTGNPCHDVTVLACEYAGFALRLEHSSDDFRAVVALAAAGAGVALVPRSALRGMELTGVEVRPIDGVAPTRRVFAAVRRGAEEHPLISPVLSALRTASESGA